MVPRYSKIPLGDGTNLSLGKLLLSLEFLFNSFQKCIGLLSRSLYNQARQLVRHAQDPSWWWRRWWQKSGVAHDEHDKRARLCQLVAHAQHGSAKITSENPIQYKDD